jgi:hypothetical protein
MILLLAAVTRRNSLGLGPEILAFGKDGCATGKANSF